MKSTYIAWTRYHRQSELWAQHFGASMYFISVGQQGRVLEAPARYALQGLRTWRVLTEERPDVVFVQNPPIFCALLAAQYARRFGARFVIDSHSGAFLSRKWRWSLWLHRRLSERAVTTIVTNDHLKSIVNGWGSAASLLRFSPGHYPTGEPFPMSGEFNVAVVCVFEEDEPLDLVFQAAGRLPAISFYVTGDAKRLPRRLALEKPANCILTGYLPYEQYIGLLRSVDAIMDLTTRDHTLVMGGYEAVSLGTPLIISDWPILRDYFHQGAVHVPNNVEGICGGVQQAKRDQARLQQEILLLREQLQSEWEHNLGELRQLLEQAG